MLEIGVLHLPPLFALRGRCRRSSCLRARQMRLSNLLPPSSFLLPSPSSLLRYHSSLLPPPFFLLPPTSSRSLHVDVSLPVGGGRRERREKVGERCHGLGERGERMLEEDVKDWEREVKDWRPSLKALPTPPASPASLVHRLFLSSCRPVASEACYATRG